MNIKILIKSENKAILVVLLLINVAIANSQNINYGATLNIGMSQMTSNLEPSVDYQTKYTVSGYAGAYFEKRTGIKSSIGGEFLWIQMEGKEVTNNKKLTAINAQGMIETVGNISDISKVHSGYFGLPVYYKINFKKVGLKIGFQTMIFLFGSSSYEATGELNGKPFQNSSKTSGLKFDWIDYGPKIGIDYELNKTLNLRTDFYVGIPDITPEFLQLERKNRQITLGINYLITKPKI